MEIEELHLLSSDIDQTGLFYSDVLGLQIISKTIDVIGFQAGNSILYFHKTEIANPVYHFAFTVKSNLLQNAFLQISKMAIMIPGIDGENIVDFAAWQAKAFYFFDNNGNIVECISRSPVDRLIQSEEEIVYSISEAGMVVDEVTTFAKEVIVKYNVDYFTRQPKHTNSFSVLGDDEGLLILVPPGRDWYPTKISSQKFWTKIKCRIGDNLFELLS